MASPRNRSTPLDAIVVPASRRAFHLRWIVELAAQSELQLVVLASHACDLDDAATLVADVPGARSEIVHVPGSYSHEDLSLATAAQRFRDLSAGRDSNLSLKRNLGLLLARLRGWRKILFLDDDVLGITPQALARLAHHLEDHRFAGLRTVAKPDNSVVCHAHRLSGADQDVFVTGAALAVNTADLPLDVFPDIYNEDWFAMAHEASEGGVGRAGSARQLDFNPFDSPQRAAHEEFGDLLAEGLFALLDDGDSLAGATRSYWDQFIDSRRRLICEIDDRLKHVWTHEAVQAENSLARASTQLESISPDDCLDFVDAWTADRDRFGKTSMSLMTGLPVAAAMEELHLPTWRVAEFANPRVRLNC